VLWCFLPCAVYSVLWCVQGERPAPWLWDWRNQYWWLPKIMARYPEAEGFLWTNDDVIVNYWKFLGADKTKLWLPNDPSSSETRHFPYDDTVGLQNTVSGQPGFLQRGISDDGRAHATLTRTRTGTRV